MSSTTIRPGGLVALDPSEVRLFEFDWGAENLEAAVQILSSEFSIIVVKQADPANTLTKDNESILAGNRATQVRLDATETTAGDRYLVANKIVTTESPSETKERSFTVLIQNL